MVAVCLVEMILRYLSNELISKKTEKDRERNLESIPLEDLKKEKKEVWA